MIAIEKYEPIKFILQNKAITVLIFLIFKDHRQSILIIIKLIPNFEN